MRTFIEYIKDNTIYVIAFQIVLNILSFLFEPLALAFFMPILIITLIASYIDYKKFKNRKL